MTILELFLTAISKTYHTLARLGQLKMSAMDIYKQQDLIIGNIEKWNISELYGFVQKLNCHKFMNDIEISKPMNLNQNYCADVELSIVSNEFISIEN